MVDGRTIDSPEPPIDYDGTENGKTRNNICNRRIAYATTATVDKDRFSGLCTLDIRPEKKIQNRPSTRLQANLRCNQGHLRHYCSHHS